MNKEKWITISKDESGNLFVCLMYGIIATLIPTAILFVSVIDSIWITTEIFWAYFWGTVGYVIGTILLLAVLIRLLYLHDKAMKKEKHENLKTEIEKELKVSK